MLTTSKGTRANDLQSSAKSDVNPARITVAKSSSHHLSQNEIDSDYPCFSTLLLLEPHPKASRTFAERILATLRIFRYLQQARSGPSIVLWF
jgi:hypothetical protein